MVYDLATCMDVDLFVRSYTLNTINSYSNRVLNKLKNLLSLTASSSIQDKGNNHTV